MSLNEARHTQVFIANFIIIKVERYIAYVKSSFCQIRELERHFGNIDCCTRMDIGNNKWVNRFIYT